MSQYVDFKSVKTLLKYSEEMAIEVYPDNEVMQKWIDDLKLGAYDQCIDLFHTVEAQYRNAKPSRNYPFSAAQVLSGYDDIYQGVPPAIHLIMCQDEATLAENPENFVTNTDYEALYPAIKTWDVEFLVQATIEADGWDFSFLTSAPEPEPPEPEPPEPEPPKPEPPKPEPPSKPKAPPKKPKPEPELKPPSVDPQPTPV
ncbi:MAG: hypothetical protein ACPG4T_21710, partial [Nannocystaceae bacterium]